MSKKHFNMLARIVAQIADPQERRRTAERLVEDADCEVFHYVGIRWNELPNLDSMTQEELVKINDDPNMPAELREYASIKWRAMLCRSTGHIDLALSWERAADSCYKLLPENLKW